MKRKGLATKLLGNPASATSAHVTTGFDTGHAAPPPLEIPHCGHRNKLNSSSTRRLGEGEGDLLGELVTCSIGLREKGESPRNTPADQEPSASGRHRRVAGGCGKRGKAARE